MAGKGQKIHIQHGHIHRQMRDTLGAVADKYRARFMGGCRERLYVVGTPEHIGQRRHRHDLRSLGKEALEPVEGERAVLFAFEENDLRPCPLRGLLPRQEIAVVLHDGHNDLIVLLKGHAPVAVGHKIQALCRIPRKNDLLAAGRVDEPRHMLPRVLIGLRGRDRETIKPPHRIGIVLAIIFRGGRDHTSGLLCRRRIVQIMDLVLLQNRE